MTRRMLSPSRADRLRFAEMAARYVENIGRRIRERREELDLTQAELARALPGTVDGAQVSRWERGKHKPNDSTLEDLAKVLDVSSVAYFLTDGPSKPAEPPARSDQDASQLDRIEAMLAEVIERLDEHGIGTPTPAEVAEQAAARLGKPPDTSGASRGAQRRSKRRT